MDDRGDERLDVVLDDGGAALPGDLRLALPAASLHGIGCVSCAGRDPLANALAAAFVARARGTGPWFDRVLLLGATGDVARVAHVLEFDPVMRARFKSA